MQVQAEIQLSGESGNQRSSERYGTHMPVGVRRSGSVSVSAVVTDMSTTGFRVESTEKLPMDSVVWLKLGHLSPLMARVVWTDRLVAGCRFAAPLHPAVLEQFVAGTL